ncbi:Inner membrane protein YbaN [Providencia manganoxydans]
MNIKKGFLILMGWTAVILACLGVVLPVLPTTPFLLLAAWCFSRSSPRFHHWLLYRSWFGSYIRHWQTYKGLPKGAKPKAIIVILVTFTISIWVVSFWWLKLGLFALLCWLLIFMYRLPVVDKPTV